MLAAAIVAAVVALGVVIAIERRAALVGLVDLPNERSSHVTPRPRGGGVGILAGVAAGLAVVSFVLLGEAGPAWPIVAVLAASLLVAAVGLWDDVASLGARPRLAVQTAAAGFVVWTCGGMAFLPLPAPLDVPVGAFGVVLAVVWIVAVTNFFNFMDGADGLAGGQACLTCALVAWACAPSPAAVVAALVCAATAGFLVRNWAPAKIFLGDVGSGYLGFTMAALPFTMPPVQRESLVLLVATSLALFLVDPMATLVRRYVRGAVLTASHREHAYQRLFDPRLSHARVVVGLLVASLILAVLAALAFERPAWAWPVVVAAAVVVGVEWWAAARWQR